MRKLNYLGKELSVTFEETKESKNLEIAEFGESNIRSTCIIFSVPSWQTNSLIITRSLEKTVDDFLKMGNYCFLILFISEFILLGGAGNMIYMIFAASAPRISCHGSNFTIENVCRKYPNLSSLPDCELEIQYEFKSLNVEFEYYCSQGHWVKSSISVQMGGVMLGTIFFGIMSDRYGRKRCLVIAFIISAILSIICSYSTSLIYFTAARSILGFFNGGLLGTYGVYKLEHIPKKHRFWVMTIIAWAPNFILLNGIAYLAHDWRTFQRVLVLISSPALVLFFFVHESPRWLIQKGRIEEARKVLQRIQQIDRQKETKREEMEKMLDVASQKMQAQEEKLKNYTPRHLFYTKEMAIATIVYCVGLFMVSMVNYGLIFNIESLAGSFFLNSILIGSIRWAINIVFAILDYKIKSLGRKIIHLMAQSTIAMCFLVISLTFIFDLDEKYATVIRVATITASATSSQMYITKHISGMEFYPTVVRNTAMAFKSTFSRVGTVIAPLLFLLPWVSVPYVILTFFAAADAIAFQLLIPETKGKPLPEDRSANSVQEVLASQVMRTDEFRVAHLKK
ncbi:unnamed protein product [Cylicocyclus nassatus]|uniref:Major facilitator superfamily (MFS) profile domain-containing protein n=1 Tax=Cylicocyclus nassatus TaxID=53992 RepID=A0AA36H645_CYLNA|nr:unnamed protein product [Cylicocyclus nassatus]